MLQTCWEGEGRRARARERGEAWRPNNTLWTYTNQGASFKHLKAAVILVQICGCLGLGLKMLRFLHIGSAQDSRRWLVSPEAWAQSELMVVGGASDFWWSEICTSKLALFLSGCHLWSTYLIVQRICHRHAENGHAWCATSWFQTESTPSCNCFEMPTCALVLL